MMKYIFHKQAESLKPRRWILWTKKPDGLFLPVKGWRGLHIRAISCFQSAKKHELIELSGVRACVSPFTRRYTAEQWPRFFHAGNKGTRTMKMSEKRKKPGLEWRWRGGVDTKERDVIKPISGSRLENNRLRGQRLLLYRARKERWLHWMIWKNSSPQYTYWIEFSFLFFGFVSFLFSRLWYISGIREAWFSSKFMKISAVRGDIGGTRWCFLFFAIVGGFWINEEE